MIELRLAGHHLSLLCVFILLASDATKHVELLANAAGNWTEPDTRRRSWKQTGRLSDCLSYMAFHHWSNRDKLYEVHWECFQTRIVDSKNKKRMFYFNTTGQICTTSDYKFPINTTSWRCEPLDVQSWHMNTTVVSLWSESKTEGCGIATVTTEPFYFLCDANASKAKIGDAFHSHRETMRL